MGDAFLTTQEENPIYNLGVDNLAHSLYYFNPAEVLSFVILPLSKTWKEVSCNHDYHLIGKTFVLVEELAKFDAAMQA